MGTLKDMGLTSVDVLDSNVGSKEGVHWCGPGLL